MFVSVPQPLLSFATCCDPPLGVCYNRQTALHHRSILSATRRKGETPAHTVRRLHNSGAQPKRARASRPHPSIQPSLNILVVVCVLAPT